jgi:hypothetical protein
MSPVNLDQKHGFSHVQLRTGQQLLVARQIENQRSLNHDHIIEFRMHLASGIGLQTSPMKSRFPLA